MVAMALSIILRMLVGGNLIRSQQFVMPIDEVDHRALFTNNNAGTHLSFSFRAPALFEQYGRHTIYFTSKYKQDIGFVFDGTTSMAFCELGGGYYLSFEKASVQPSTMFSVGDTVTIELDLPQNVLKTYVNGVLNQSYPITATNRGTTYSVGITHGAYSVHEFVLDDVMFKKLA